MWIKNVPVNIVAIGGGIIISIITLIIIYVLLTTHCAPHPSPPAPIPLPPAPLPVPPRPIPPGPSPHPTPIPDTDTTEWLTGEVVNVITADRITIAVDHITLPLLRRRRYTLWGIEAPRIGDKHYRNANNYLRQLLSNQSVAYVELDNGAIWLYMIENRSDMVNFLVVREGWAKATDNMFRQAQEYAQQNRLGMWGN